MIHGAHRAAGMLSLLLVGISQADTLYVNGTCGDDAWTGRSPVCNSPDGPMRHIKTAVDAASDGDTIIIADGVYSGELNQNIDVYGRAISLMSEGGPRRCIIDCVAGGGPFIRASNAQHLLTEGLTIRNAISRDSGGAIQCDRIDITIRNCVLSGNRSDDEGGALYLRLGGVRLVDSLFTNNHARRSGGAVHISAGGLASVEGCRFSRNATSDGIHSGGAIQVRAEEVLVAASTFSENYATLGGAGLACSYANSLSLIRSRFERNIAERGGGGIDVSGVEWTLVRDCDIRGNRTGEVGRGGGIHVANDAVLERCTISNNMAGSAGGGVYAGGPVSIRECVIQFNTVTRFSGRGGGVYCNGESVAIAGSTLGGNISISDGAGLSIHGAASVSIIRSSILDNLSSGGAGGAELRECGNALLNDCVSRGMGAETTQAASICGTMPAYPSTVAPSWRTPRQCLVPALRACLARRLLRTPSYGRIGPFRSSKPNPLR